MAGGRCGWAVEVCNSNLLACRARMEWNRRRRRTIAGGLDVALGVAAVEGAVGIVVFVVPHPGFLRVRFSQRVNVFVASDRVANAGWDAGADADAVMMQPELPMASAGASVDDALVPNR